MANNDRNRTGETKEPNREAPADRSGQPAGQPGGYGPKQGQFGERIGNTNEPPKGSTREPSREH